MDQNISSNYKAVGGPAAGPHAQRTLANVFGLPVIEGRDMLLQACAVAVDNQPQYAETLRLLFRSPPETALAAVQRSLMPTGSTVRQHGPATEQTAQQHCASILDRVYQNLGAHGDTALAPIEAVCALYRKVRLNSPIQDTPPPAPPALNFHDDDGDDDDRSIVARELAESKYDQAGRKTAYFAANHLEPLPFMILASKGLRLPGHRLTFSEQTDRLREPLNLPEPTIRRIFASAAQTVIKQAEAKGTNDVRDVVAQALTAYTEPASAS